MDRPSEYEMNASLLWKEFILSKILLIFGGIITLITMSLNLVSTYVPMWNVYDSNIIPDRSYQANIGLLWYNVLETNFNNTSPRSNFGPYLYTVAYNAYDRMIKEKYSIIGGITFSFMKLSLIMYIVSAAFTIGAIIGCGNKTWIMIEAYLSWGLSLFSSLVQLSFTSLYPMVAQHDKSLFIPVNDDLSSWVISDKARLQVDVSWFVSFISSLVCFVVQTSIISVPLFIILYRKRTSQ